MSIMSSAVAVVIEAKGLNVSVRWESCGLCDVNWTKHGGQSEPPGEAVGYVDITSGSSKSATPFMGKRKAAYIRACLSSLCRDDRSSEETLSIH